MEIYYNQSGSLQGAPTLEELTCMYLDGCSGPTRLTGQDTVMCTCTTKLDHSERVHMGALVCEGLVCSCWAWWSEESEHVCICSPDSYGRKSVLSTREPVFSKHHSYMMIA